MADDYYKNRNDKNTLKIREILTQLPYFVNEFFLGIQMRTSPLTRLNYAYDIRVFFDFLIKNKFFDLTNINQITLSHLEQILPLDLEIYLEYLTSYEFNGQNYKCEAAAKERKLSTIRSFFKYYYNKDKLSQNITTKVDLPKIHEKPIIRLEPDEVVKLLNLAEDGNMLTDKQKDFQKFTKDRDVAILTLFLGTGIRISELVGLNKTDIDFNANAFSVTRKGGGKQILYFSDEVLNALNEYTEWLENQIYDKTNFANKIKNHDALFLSLQGNRISVRAVQLLVTKFARIVSPLKRITPHKLRSTYGTTLYQETQDIYVVAEVLGHRDVNTTKKHYAAMSDEIRRTAAKAVKLKK